MLNVFNVTSCENNLGEAKQSGGKWVERYGMQPTPI